MRFVAIGSWWTVDSSSGRLQHVERSYSGRHQLPHVEVDNVAGWYSRPANQRARAQAARRRHQPSHASWTLCILAIELSVGRDPGPVVDSSSVIGHHGRSAQLQSRLRKGFRPAICGGFGISFFFVSQRFALAGLAAAVCADFGFCHNVAYLNSTIFVMHLLAYLAFPPDYTWASSSGFMVV